MQPEYLDRLSQSVQHFVREVEAASGVPIGVVPTPELNGGGPFRQGNLDVVVRARQVLLGAPTNGYFPDGAVRHEVLHVKRCHIDGVPQLVLADSVVPWDQAVSDMLAGLDNAIEHLVIVPEELRLHPERRDHWEAQMQEICDDLPNIPEEHVKLAICMHWTFLRQVLPDSLHIPTMGTFAAQKGMFDTARSFADQLLSRLASKEEILCLLFDTFPEIGRARAGLDYINSVTGTRHRPIP
ncbi:MAG TPA: hypothetical protein VGM81_25940 [Burkholderiaceae bacterium]|jgi:hypothetical protein